MTFLCWFILDMKLLFSYTATNIDFIGAMDNYRDWNVPAIVPIWFSRISTCLVILASILVVQYLICEADKKSSQLVHFLLKNKSEKIIV